MKILWLTWKDSLHPHAGGAEVVADEIGKRLAADGHEVTFLTGGFTDGGHLHERDGYKVIRVGGKFSVYWEAYKYYKKNLAEKGFDIVIEEINTIPFFSKFYLGSKGKSTKVKDEPESESTLNISHSTFNSPKHFYFFHQLAREIWFYQMMFPVSLVGYLLEPLYLRLLAHSKKVKVRKSESEIQSTSESESTFNFPHSTFNLPSVITVSLSTKRDLMRFGFKEGDISIISEGVDVPALDQLTEKDWSSSEKTKVQSTKLDSDSLSNFSHLTFNSPGPTILSFGSVRPMKRTIDIIKAFEYAKLRMPALKLIIAGDATGVYGQKVARLAARSQFERDIKLLGRVTNDEKLRLIEGAHLICVTSVKEGWGLVVTEAGRRGTPAVVYNVDGLRDSVKDGVSGLVSRQNNPRSLSLSITEALSKPEYYKGLRKNAWEYAKTITFEKQYDDFKIAVGLAPKKIEYSNLVF